MTLTSHCQRCSTSKNLLRCSGCRVARYCNKTHQTADWPQHKSTCNAIKKCYTRLDRQEQELRNQPPGDMFAPENVFEEHAGHFWGLTHTRPYMRARYALVEAILKVETYDAVEAALDHLMDCLRLCRSDNMGLRDFVPALLLRLGREQKCYDFVKWYETTGSAGDYDWGDLEAPFLDVEDADLLESPKYLCGTLPDLSHIVSITLLKVNLLLAVRAGSGGREMLKSSQIFNQMEGKNTSVKDEDREKEQVDVIKVLKSHVKMLYESVDDSNRFFWPALLDPGLYLDTRPEYFSHGSHEEMELVLQRSYLSWKESPGAIELIEAISLKQDY